MTTFNFINTGKFLNTEVFVVNKNSKAPTLSFVKTKKTKSNFLTNFNTDESSLDILEKQITESLSHHISFLNSNLPQQVDIEIVRENKTEQLEHYLRKDNKFFFKTIQELFLSKEEKDRKNRQDKISAESVQTDSLLGNTPRIKLSTDYAKNFNPQKPPLIFDKFLTELRKSIPNTVQSKNTNEFSQVITELMVLHEAAHIILDNKINKTYLKLAYEIKDKNYEGDSLQQFARLIHEGFSDGLTTYLSKQYYTDGNASKCYRDAREKTKNKTEHKDKLNIYNTFGVIDKIINSNEINNENAVNLIFELAVTNALNKFKKKFESSENFKSKVTNDLTFIESQNGINLDKNKIIDSLRINLFEQLNNPLDMEEILAKKEENFPKKLSLKSFDEIFKIRDKYLNNQSINIQRKP